MWKTFEEMPEEGRPLLIIEIGDIADQVDGVDWHGAYLYHAYVEEDGFGHAVFRTDWKTQSNEKLSHLDHQNLKCFGKWAYLADVIRSAMPFASPEDGHVPEAIFTNGDRPYEGRITGPENGFIA